MYRHSHHPSLSGSAPPAYGNYPPPGPAHQVYQQPYNANPRASYPGPHHVPLGGGNFTQPAPPGADPQLWSWFVTVDDDRSGAIDASELQRALRNGNWSPFDVDTCRMLMTMFDVDRNGMISFNEFVSLYNYVGEWQTIFHHFDADRSGAISAPELTNALSAFGFRLSYDVVQLLENKYSSLPGTATGITFDRFVRACVVVKTLTESFRSVDTDGDGWAMMDYSQFLTLALSTP